MEEKINLKELILYIMVGVISTICVISILDSCSISKNGDGSYTRLYPITSYEMDDKTFTFSFTVEDGSEITFIESLRHNDLYFHDGEDTLVVISSEKEGKGTDGLKRSFIYLNSEKAKEYFGTMIDSMVENGG